MTLQELCPECRSSCLHVRTRDVDLNDGYGHATEYAWRCPNCSEEFYSLLDEELKEVI